MMFLSSQCCSHKNTWLYSMWRSLTWYRWSAAALLSIVSKHSSVDSQHYSVYMSSICKWWLIIYHSLHQSSKLVVCSRPLPLPRTMGPFPVGCEAEEGAKQASIVEQGHHISVSCPWNERFRRTVRFMVCSLGGYRARLQTSYWPLPREYPDNLVGGMSDFVKISMMQHITEKR